MTTNKWIFAIVALCAILLGAMYFWSSHRINQMEKAVIEAQTQKEQAEQKMEEVFRQWEKARLSYQKDLKGIEEDVEETTASYSLRELADAFDRDLNGDGSNSGK